VKYCLFNIKITNVCSLPKLSSSSVYIYILFVTAASPHDEELPFTKILLSNTPTDFNIKNSLSTGNQVMRSAARSVDYSVGCGETKGCFNDDDGSLVTFAMSLDGGHLNIELQTEVGTSYDWIAVGFAPGPYMVSLKEIINNYCRFLGMLNFYSQHTYCRLSKTAVSGE